MGTAERIISELPPHRVFLSPFAGRCAVTWKKRPAERTVLADRSAAVVRWWQRAGANAYGGGRPSVPTPDAVALQVHHGCGVALLASWEWRGGEVVYLDPPYHHDTRTDLGIYGAHELSHEDHVRLLDVLRSLPCPVALSHPVCPLYADALSDWRRVPIRTGTRSGWRTEPLWCNYPPPAALHDFRYLGENRRDRERIRKKVGRWRAGLERLPHLERLAILSELAALIPGGAAAFGGGGHQRRHAPPHLVARDPAAASGGARGGAHG